MCRDVSLMTLARSVAGMMQCGYTAHGATWSPNVQAHPILNLPQLYSDPPDLSENSIS